tara:strand:- start:28 stop:678 length:651 start_codon:yes stop_codon:yes gene_type:complete
MSYFRELPDILYQSPFKERNSSTEYIRIKNLFRRVKLRDDLKDAFTLFDQYQIRDGDRPEQVAKELYNSVEFDWVVITGAGITNLRNDWPISDKDLYKYAENKYGVHLNAIRHYETIEVKDAEGRLILPKGKIVDQGFTIPKPNDPKATINPTGGVTNFEHETRINNKKRGIYVLKPSYLGMYVEDMRRIMQYERSSQFVDRKTVITENTRNTSPQ